MKTQMIRQGDVLVRRVKRIPSDVKAVPRESGEVVLAHGEATGHRHAIVERQAEMWSGGGGTWLSVGDGGATLKHEEHAPIPLDPGKYQVVRQREHSDEDEVRYVAD